VADRRTVNVACELVERIRASRPIFVMYASLYARSIAAA